MNFLGIIFRNFSAKIICLILAVGLWIYVGIGQTKTAFFPGDIPLQVKNVPQGLVAVTDIEKLKVKIVAESDSWKKLSADSFSAFLDLSGLLEGTHEIKVVVTCNVQNVQIVETDPEKVLVSLEPRITKEVPVNVLIDGKAGEGLVVGQWKADPAKVEVSGAKTLVQRLLEATAKIHLEGQTSEFKQIVKLVGLDSQGKEISNLEFKPAEVIVTVPIVKASNVKTVGIKVSTTGSPAEGYWVAKIETEPATVTIAASDQMAGKIEYVETKEVNLDGLAKNTTVETTLKSSSDFSVLDNISQVKVKVFISQAQATKELEVGFKWQGLAGNLKVVAANPSTVKVVISGPEEKLAVLTPGDIAIVVDLTGITTAGNHSLDITRSNISGPTGVSFSSIVPSAINVQTEVK